MHVTLGLHFGHDANAAILVNGEIIADVEEERFTRLKHATDDPYQALGYCLDAANVSMEQVNEIALAGTSKKQVLGLYRLTGQLPQDFSGRPGPVQTPTYLRTHFIDALPPVTLIDHHEAHAAAAYLTSGEQRPMLVVTLDGIGDKVSAAIWRGEDGQLTRLESFGPEGSLGWFYSNVTEALGWWHGDGEGKTMGLASYGKPGRHSHSLDGHHPVYRDGALTEPKAYEPFGFVDRRGGRHWHNDEALEIQKLLEHQDPKDLAAEAQQVLEEQALALVLPWLEREQCDVLATSGGVFLNVKLNQRLWESPQVSTHYPYPNAGDSGLALGAALQVANRSGYAPEAPLRHLYFGPAYSAPRIEKLLKERQLSFRHCDDPCARAAQLLAEGKVIGWFQGRMESGPRALGHRSILASPLDVDNRDRVNAKIKFREQFRPFCPSMKREAVDRYLRNARTEPFMITSFDGLDAAMSDIPAVVHVDGTLRPQTVDRAVNPRYWRLLDAFEALTGVPVLLNTSMNLQGEPIACSPSDALRCYFDSGMDALMLGEYLLEKGR